MPRDVAEYAVNVIRRGPVHDIRTRLMADRTRFMLRGPKLATSSQLRLARVISGYFFESICKPIDYPLKSGEVERLESGRGGENSTEHLDSTHLSPPDQVLHGSAFDEELGSVDVDESAVLEDSLPSVPGRPSDVANIRAFKRFHAYSYCP